MPNLEIKFNHYSIKWRDFSPAFIGNQNAILNCGAPTDASIIEAFWSWTQMVYSTHQNDTEKERFSLGIKQ